MHAFKNRFAIFKTKQARDIGFIEKQMPQTSRAQIGINAAWNYDAAFTIFFEQVKTSFGK